jgi:tetratricopeptide (TPR) repeat protein
MNKSISQALLGTNDPAEKAAIVAEFVLDALPRGIALIARQCVLFHWFDQTIVEALLEDHALAQTEASEVLERVISLPFIETLAWGWTFQDLTREGLLKRYAVSDRERLITAARAAAPVYQAREEYGMIAVEAFFCYAVAGDTTLAIHLLGKLLEEGIHREDWQYIDGLLRLRIEAEQLPFVARLPLTEQQWMLIGLVHRIQGKLEEAGVDFSNALTINPKNALI